MFKVIPQVQVSDRVVKQIAIEPRPRVTEEVVRVFPQERALMYASWRRSWTFWCHKSWSRVLECRRTFGRSQCRSAS